MQYYILCPNKKKKSGCLTSQLGDLGQDISLCITFLVSKPRRPVFEDY